MLFPAGLRKVLFIVLPLAALVGLSLWIENARRSTLLGPSFLTGWALAIVLGLSALTWVRAVPGIQGLRQRVGGQLVVGAMMLVLFLVHIELRIPDGWIEGALAIGFEALMAGMIIGGLLVYGGEAGAPRLRRWLRIQVALHWALLSVSMFHGIFTHVHCALAHYLFYSD